MQKSMKQALVIGFVVSLSGCASITGSEMQTVALSAQSSSGVALDKTNCTLKNDKGEWQAVAPAQVQIRRSADDLIVSCKKEGFVDGMLRAISRAANGMWGNIVFGGGVGALIDHNKGTGYDYPSSLPVRMGETVTVDRAVEKANDQKAVNEPVPAKTPEKVAKN